MKDVIYSINGPVVTVKDTSTFGMAEMVYVGNAGLIGEVISVSEARTVQLAEKKITLHVTPTEVNVAAEPALLDQALGNLLDNAIDFTPESGRITLSAEVDQEHVTLKVLDTGSGIPDYALSRIFERFYSLPRANGQKSSGLGLAFVSEVARLFNGEVTLRNVQEGGVLASLRLHRHFT